MAATRPTSAVSVETAIVGLADVLAQLNAAAALEEVQAIVGSAARRLTGADGAAFVLRDGDQCFYAHEDAIEPLWKGRRLASDGCVSGWVMRWHEPAVIPDIYADDRVEHELYRPTFVKSLVMVPVGAGEPIGAIGLYWAAEHAAGELELGIAQALAAGTAGALERVRIADRLRVAARENERLAREIEERRLTEQDLRELSERDPLTGLLNRRAWDRALAGALRQRREPVYVALIDLDHFKTFNDRFGHPAGDALLRRAARGWRDALRSGDILARYGGEEFAVLLMGCEAERAIEIAERLRLATVDEQSSSIGIARWDGAETGDSVTARADAALYDAKRGGRNRVVLAD